MFTAIVILLLIAILPPPLPLLIACFVFAYFFLRELLEGWAENHGHDPGRAQRRHDAYMQRMAHQHERWKAGHDARMTRLASDHPRISRALQGRVARWIDGWGTGIRAVDDRDTADREAGRQPGSWRAAWRRARQRASATFRDWATSAEERLDNRGRVIEPAPEPTPAVRDDAVEIHAEDDVPPAAPTAGPDADWAGGVSAPPGGSLGDAGPGPQRTPSWWSDARGGQIAADPPVIVAVCPTSPTSNHQTEQRETTLGTRTGCVHCGIGFGAARLVDEATGRATCPHLTEHRGMCGNPIDPNATNQSDCGQHHEPPPDGRPQLSVVPNPQDAPATPPVEPPQPQGDHPNMSEDVINLASGQTVNPEAGKQLSTSSGEVLGELNTRWRNSIDTLTKAGVDPAQIAEMQELVNLVQAANDKAGSITGHFEGHQQAQGAVESTGAGTEAGYLRRR